MSGTDDGLSHLAFHLAALEIEPQRELEVPRQTGLARDLSELAGSRIQVGAAEVRVIREVVTLRAELESGSLVDNERLEQREVPILEARLVDGVAHTRLQVESTVRRRRAVGREILHRAGVAARSGIGACIDGDGSVQDPERAPRATTEAAEFA